MNPCSRSIRPVFLAAASIALVLLATCAPTVSAGPAATPPPFRRPDVKHVIVVVLENEDAADAYRQPFFEALRARGASFENFFALTHPSQPNYIGLVSGSMHGVDTNDLVDLDVRHLGNLLEAKGLDWKVYAEAYPGNCYLGQRAGVKSEGEYVRRHVPFLSFVDVQKNPARCARIVGATQFDRDLAAGRLPAFALYIPHNRNNGHDTGVRFAAKAMEKRFGGLVSDPAFLKQTLFVLTFDESGRGGGNRILTILIGDSVKPGTIVRERYDLYSLLRTIEEIFGTGTLGLEDARANPIGGIWK